MLGVARPPARAKHQPTRMNILTSRQYGYAISGITPAARMAAKLGWKGRIIAPASVATTRKMITRTRCQTRAKTRAAQNRDGPRGRGDELRYPETNQMGRSSHSDQHTGPARQRRNSDHGKAEQHIADHEQDCRQPLTITTGEYWLMESNTAGDCLPRPEQGNRSSRSRRSSKCPFDLRLLIMRGQLSRRNCFGDRHLCLSSKRHLASNSSGPDLNSGTDQDQRTDEMS